MLKMLTEKVAIRKKLNCVLNYEEMEDCVADLRRLFLMTLFCRKFNTKMQLQPDIMVIRELFFVNFSILKFNFFSCYSKNKSL